MLTSLGITTILVTHDQHEALAFGDRVGVVEAGVLRQFGTPAEVYSRPATPWVATFVGEATLLPARLTGVTARTSLGTFATAPIEPGDGLVMLRPEQVGLTDGSDGVVTAVDYVGPSTRYEVAIGDDLAVLSTVPGPPARRVGDRVGTLVGSTVHAWHGTATERAGHDTDG